MHDVTTDEVMRAFLERMRADLTPHNVLRGAWVEQIVAAFLGIRDFPAPWSYFDLRDSSGRRISVKHSVGDKARFSVTGSRWAWDESLAAERRRIDKKAEVWLDNEDGTSKRWCDVYVYAHLPEPLTPERVENVDAWRFAVIPLTTLEALPESTRTVGLARIEQIGVTWVPGDALGRAIEAVCPRK